MLTLTMIMGVITVVGLLVTRMQQGFPTQTAAPTLPAGISLPAGATPQAVTFGANWVAIVTEDNRILVYSSGGELQQEVQITVN